MTKPPLWPAHLHHFCHETPQIEWGAARHGAGNNLFIFVRDPDGNPVEISA